MQKVRVVQFGVVAIIGVLMALPSFVSAEAHEEEDERKPQLGTIAGTRVGSGFEGMEIDAAGFQDQDAFSESRAPLTGSVSRQGKRNWVAKLFNNSENTYAVNVKVREMDKRGNKTRSVSYSAVIKGGDTWERSFTGRTSTAQASLELVSFRNLTKKKKAAEEANAEEGSEEAAN